MEQNLRDLKKSFKLLIYKYVVDETVQHDIVKGKKELIEFVKVFHHASKYVQSENDKNVCVQWSG